MNPGRLLNNALKFAAYEEFPPLKQQEIQAIRKRANTMQPEAWLTSREMHRMANQIEKTNKMFADLFFQLLGNSGWVDRHGHPLEMNAVIHEVYKFLREQNLIDRDASVEAALEKHENNVKACQIESLYGYTMPEIHSLIEFALVHGYKPEDEKPGYWQNLMQVNAVNMQGQVPQ